jgi:hypothetical protein
MDGQLAIDINKVVASSKVCLSPDNSTRTDRFLCFGEAEEKTFSSSGRRTTVGQNCNETEQMMMQTQSNERKV